MLVRIVFYEGLCMRKSMTFERCWSKHSSFSMLAFEGLRIHIPTHFQRNLLKTSSFLTFAFLRTSFLDTFFVDFYNLSYFTMFAEAPVRVLSYFTMFFLMRFSSDFYSCPRFCCIIPRILRGFLTK